MIVPFVFASLSAQAQELPIPALSPRAEIMQEVGVVEVRVNYARPAKRDREIFGGLVPYGKLWRTGANLATTLELSDAVVIGETTIAPGKYALFTEPGEDSWTVIINGDPNQGGTGAYDKGLDLVRFDVTPTEGPATERLTFAFDDVTDTGASLDLMWDGVKVAIPITVETDKMLDTAVGGFVRRASRQLAQAARHYSRHGAHDKAVDAADLAIDAVEDWYTLWTKAEVLRADDNLRQARRYARLAKRSGDRAVKAGGSFPDSYRERIVAATTEWR